MEPASTTGQAPIAAFPIEKVRAAFPALEREVHGRPVAYLDSGASAQRVLASIQAVDRYERAHHSNVHRGSHTLSAEEVRRRNPVALILSGGPASVYADGAPRVDPALFDLGVSSLQLDEGDRGFAYAHDAPLAMRMDQGSGATAADVLNTYDAHDLERILRLYGEERFARRVAAAIVRVLAAKGYPQAPSTLQAAAPTKPHA